MNELRVSTSDIFLIATTIATIARQTNLLALSASVEASRAGEAECGFAVVADQIKRHAQGTGDATENITEKVVLLMRSSEGLTVEMEQITELLKEA